MSARSFAVPLLLTTLRRLRNTGTPLLTTGRRSRRNGVRSRVATFAVATSGSRSSSAARRLTKVVFAWRRVGGNAVSTRSSEVFSRAIAPSASLPFWVSAERSLRRSAIAFTTREPSWRKSLNACWSRVSWAKRRRAASRLGLKYL